MAPRDEPPATRTAIVQDRYGRAGDVLRLVEGLPLPVPAANEVRIAVHAAGINPIDWQMIEGNRRLIARRRFPFVPLFDLAGIVTAIGGSVTRFTVGDAVHADNKNEGGGASTCVCVDEALVSHKPASLSFAEAAALPLAGQTALLALDRAEVGKGVRVCIVGASGGVGSFAVQLAKARSAAHVVVVCGARNAGFVRALGADAVIDYARDNMTTALPAGSLDAVIDCVGGKAQWDAARVVLRPGGTFATIARDEDGPVTIPSATRMIATISKRRLASRFGRRIRYVPVFLDASHDLLDRVDAEVDTGRLQVPITREYPFTRDGIVAALEDSRAGHMAGKAVVAVTRTT